MFSFSPIRGRDARTLTPFLIATEIGACEVLLSTRRWADKFLIPRDVATVVLFYAVKLPAPGPRSVLAIADYLPTFRAVSPRFLAEFMPLLLVVRSTLLLRVC